MEDKRIYVLVPETVQVDVAEFFPEDSYHPGVVRKPITKTYKMVAGRLVAQGVHVGRMLGNWYFNRGNPEITTITLSVRNTKELRKVSNEVKAIVDKINDSEESSDMIAYEEFHDTNVEFYGTFDKVHTITGFGPVSREDFESAIGHLELL
jgi:hypothetical protein